MVILSNFGVVVIIVIHFNCGDALVTDESCARRRPWRVFEPSWTSSRKISLTSQADVSDSGSATEHKEMAMLLYKSMRNNWERRRREAVSKSSSTGHLEPALAFVSPRSMLREMRYKCKRTHSHVNRAAVYRRRLSLYLHLPTPQVFAQIKLGQLLGVNVLLPPMLSLAVLHLLVETRPAADGA